MRWWWLNGFRWAECVDALAGPLVVCDRVSLIRLLEEGRPVRVMRGRGR